MLLLFPAHIRLQVLHQSPMLYFNVQLDFFQRTFHLSQAARSPAFQRCRCDLRCRGWWIRAPWQCGQLLQDRRWSGLPTCWRRPQQHRPASASLPGGQEVSINAAGPPWYPWKGGHLTGQSVRSSTAFQAAPHSVKVEQWPGDEERVSYHHLNWVIVCPG